MNNTELLIPHEILLVDDDSILRVFHKIIVKKIFPDARIREFLNGKEALNFVLNNNEEAKHYLMLLDINMPVMNGWDLLDELSEIDLKCEINVIMITSSLDNEDLERSKQYPILVDYLKKPISVSSLNQALKSIKWLKL